MYAARAGTPATRSKVMTATPLTAHTTAPMNSTCCSDGPRRSRRIVRTLSADIATTIATAPGTARIVYPLGLAAGWLFYLGAHAIHEEWKRRGPVTALVAALAGAAGAAVLQEGVQAWFR